MNAQPALHPTDQTLQSYGLGKLDDTSADSVNQHLESCPDCRSRVAAMSSDSFLGKLRDAQGRPQSTEPLVSSLTGMSMLDGGATSPAPPPASTLPPGLADHPDYQILSELGRGGMGVVYLAENTLMGRKEVLKVVGSHLISRPGVLDRFLREIRSAAKLHHTNIVAAYSALRLGESLVLTMEYVEGLDLSRMVKAKGPLPVAHACNFIYQAALGLQHAHDRGMVHRDIKPANLMLSSEGKRPNVKVLDFGLAKVTSEGQTDNALTREGQMLGTPDYIAPEQIRDAQSADIRADIYSLGCTFYYLLSGGPPFGGDNLWDLYQAHFSMDATPLNLARPEVPVEVAALVAKMMAKDPAKRFQTPGEVARALLPFSKSAAGGTLGSKPETSCSGQPETISHRDATASASTQAAAGSVPTAKTATEPAQAGSILKGLIDLREKDLSFDEMADRHPPATGPQSPHAWATAVGNHKRPGLRSWRVAAGVMLFGAIVALAVYALKVKTPDGVIVLENIPENAVVEVDGNRITVAPTAGEPVKIEARAGKHVVVVKRGDEVLTGRSVTLKSGESFKIAVRYEPVTVPGAPQERAIAAGPTVGDGPDSLAETTQPKERAIATGPTIGGGPETPSETTQPKERAIAKGPMLGDGSGTPAETPQKKNRGMATGPTIHVATRPEINRSRYTILQGQWHVVGDELTQSDSRAKFPFLMFGDERWTDYDFWADFMRVTGSSDISLVFRCTGEDDYMRFAVSAKGGWKYALIEANEPGHHRWIRSAEFPIVSFKWYTARVRVRGNHVECDLVDGKDRLVHLEVNDDKHPRGQVGFRTWLAAYKLRNIRVTAPDGTVLWEGLPEIGPLEPHVVTPPADRVPQPSPGTVQRRTTKSVQTVISRFDDGNDDAWQTMNEDDTLKATAFMKVEKTDSNSWLEARDFPNSKFFGWLAPGKYLGNQADKFGRFLNYDIRTDGNGSGVSDTDSYIRLRGRGKTILVDQATLGRLDQNQWTTYSIRLDASGGWNVLADSGQITPATDDDIRYILSDIQNLWIRGEYANGVDTGGLDNVELGAGMARSSKKARRTTGRTGLVFRATTNPAQFDAIFSAFAPDLSLSTAAVGRDGGGLALNEHLGRPSVLRTHPVNRSTPCILRVDVAVSPEKARLILEVSHGKSGDWQLIVKANGRTLHDSIIGANTTIDGWAKITVDLSQFAGQKLNLELLNQANGWRNEFGYWGRIAIVPGDGNGR